MRILLHANGGPTLGVGHVMRSLALAEEAIAAGHTVVLAGEVEGEFLRGQVDGLPGLRFVPVPRPAGHGLAGLVGEVAADVVHVDAYDVDLDPAAWRGPAGAGPLLSNMEDGSFGRRGADLVVDPNLGAETEARAAPGRTLLLRGSRYAPLRRAVTQRRGHWVAREHADRVLVVMGGTDPRQLTGPVLDLLGRTGLRLRVTAVATGRAGDACAAVAAGHPRLDVRLTAPVEDLPAAMLAQDLVISASGTSVWELCCLGVPTALVCAVDNQRVGYDRLVTRGAAVGLGASADDLVGEEAAARLRALLESSAARRTLAASAAGVVDGLGAWRVVRAWEQLVGARPAAPVRQSPAIRPAALSDARTLWEWRNDETTRSHSLQPDEIPFEDHLRWLEASLTRPDRLLLVAADDSGDVGTVRWDRAGVEWEVSITVAPARRGESLARGLLAAGEQELLRHTGGPATVLARVQERNAASRRLFEGAGYVPDRPADTGGVRAYAKRLVAAPT